MSAGGLSLTLNNALTGLNINQQSLGVLSQNIANANTPGYSKQVINQQSVYIDGQGEGVSIVDVTRKINEFLVKAVQVQNSDVGKTATLNDYYTRVQLALGNPGSQNSVDSYVNKFFNGLQSLSQTPQNTALQQAAVNNGVALATQVSSLASTVNNLQFNADQDIYTAVTTINNDLNNLHDLNTTISENMALGKSVAELQDQRDSAIKDLSLYMDVHTFTKTDGTVSLTTGGGITILDTNLYKLDYTATGSAASFSTGGIMQPITVTRFDASGNPSGQPSTLVFGGTPSAVTSLLTTGKISGLLDLRDKLLPNISSQLDTLSASVRDQVNAIHNTGSGYPGTNSLTGTRPVNAADYSLWTGKVQIAVLNSSGLPVQSPWNDETNGLAPLTLDLSTLDTGNGAGNPSVQGIVDAINQYYGVPQNKVELGNLNNIQLASDSPSTPGNPPSISLDFNLNNLSKTGSNFYVTNVKVTDQTGIPSVTASSTVPTVALNAVNTYFTTPGSSNVIVKTTSPSNFTDGQIVFLNTPAGGPFDGIPAADLGGYFKVSNVTSTGFQITAANSATAGVGGLFSGGAGLTATLPYATVPPGGQMRTASNGLFTADLSTISAAQFYTVTATVGLDDGTGNIVTSDVTYQINNNVANTRNTLYGGQTATSPATIVAPVGLAPLAKASLVDINGNPLASVGGLYTTLQSGYLKIQAGSSTNVIAINSLDSKEQGQPSAVIPKAGTNRGFSHFFDLNDFFQSNTPINTGDTLANSALNLKVISALQTNPGLLSLGQLTRSLQPADPTAPPNYTYERDTGDNSVIQKLATLSSATQSFAQSGGLGATTVTFSAYSAQIISAASTNAATAKTNSTNSQTLLDGYSTQSSAVSGVNLDTELANTVIYQNAYAASARVITVANELFNTLLQSFQ